MKRLKHKLKGGEDESESGACCVGIEIKEDPAKGGKTGEKRRGGHMKRTQVPFKSLWKGITR